MENGLRNHLLAAAEQFGAPLYVYHGDTILKQYERLKSAFGQLPVKFHYAIKANSNPNILQLLHAQGCGIDAASWQEVQLALWTGVSPQDIVFTPNGVAFEEIQSGVEAGVTVNIDNISSLEQFGAAYGGRYPVAIRLNPHILAGGHAHIQVGGIDSKFGISVHQMRHVQRIVQAYNMQVCGLHMHTGSDILDAGVFLQGAEILLQAALNFPDLKLIDFGSGFKVAYHSDDITTDIEELGRQLTERMQQFFSKEEYGRELEIWFEPGKFLVSEAGWLLVRTNVVKQTVATVFAAVDSGLNHLLRPMLYDAYHQIQNLSNPEGAERIYSVVGYICETDTFGADRRLNEVREGDILALSNAGAYGFTMASNYNSRLRPAEVLLLNGKAHLIRERESLEDLTRKVQWCPELEPEASAALPS